MSKCACGYIRMPPDAEQWRNPGSMPAFFISSALLLKRSICFSVKSTSDLSNESDTQKCVHTPSRYRCFVLQMYSAKAAAFSGRQPMRPMPVSILRCTGKRKRVALSAAAVNREAAASSVSIYSRSHTKGVSFKRITSPAFSGIVKPNNKIGALIPRSRSRLPSSTEATDMYSAPHDKAFSATATSPCPYAFAFTDTHSFALPIIFCMCRILCSRFVR